MGSVIRGQLWVRHENLFRIRRSSSGGHCRSPAERGPGHGDRLAANLDVVDFELTDAEMERIFDLQGGIIPKLRHKLGS